MTKRSTCLQLLNVLASDAKRLAPGRLGRVFWPPAWLTAGPFLLHGCVLGDRRQALDRCAAEDCTAMRQHSLHSGSASPPQLCTGRLLRGLGSVSTEACTAVSQHTLHSGLTFPPWSRAVTVATILIHARPRIALQKDATLGSRRGALRLTVASRETKARLWTRGARPRTTPQQSSTRLAVGVPLLHVISLFRLVSRRELVLQVLYTFYIYIYI